MLILHTVPGAWGLPSFSPACMKLETWLRMAGVAYQVAPSLDLSLAPKGKVPFIELRGGLHSAVHDQDQAQGERMGDSTLIIDRLVADGARDPDAGLSPRERAVSLAVRRMLKEHTYWIIVAVRYTVDEHWQVYRRVIGSALAPGAPEEQWAPAVEGMRDMILAQAHAHGMGRHQTDEIRRLCRDDVHALSELLGDKPFFMGEEPTTVDATGYAYIGNLLQAPFDTGLDDDDPAVRNLRSHCDRITERYFPDTAR